MAVSIDAVGAGQNGNISSFSYSHTFSGSDRHAIIVIMTTAVNASGVTIGAVSCSLIASSRVVEGNQQIELWEPDSEPATGAQTVAGTLASKNRIQVNSVSFNGVDTGTPSSGLQTNSGSAATSSTVTVTTTLDDFVIDGMRVAADPTEDGSQVNQYAASGGGNFGEISTEAGAAGTVPMDWTFASAEFVHAAIAIKALAAAGAVRDLIMGPGIIPFAR